MPGSRPIYRPNMDDAPRPVAVMASRRTAGEHIPLHIHRRAQFLHTSSGILRVETEQTAWILPPARAVWLPSEWPHSITMRSQVEMRALYVDPTAAMSLPQQPVLVEISGLMRELILALLHEPVDFDEDGRGGIIARQVTTAISTNEINTSAKENVSPCACER